MKREDHDRFASSGNEVQGEENDHEPKVNESYICRFASVTSYSTSRKVCLDTLRPRVRLYPQFPFNGMDSQGVTGPRKRVVINGSLIARSFPRCDRPVPCPLKGLCTPVSAPPPTMREPYQDRRELPSRLPPAASPLLARDPTSRAG